MSPEALQEYAWTHLPPWQFVEQHSAPAAHVFPSVVHVGLLVASGIGAQAPLVQMLVQQSDGCVQAAPTVAHVVPPHVPPAQVRAQHSVDEEQGDPGALQNWDELHFPVESQTVEQHSALDAQFSPPPLHVAATGAVQ